MATAFATLACEILLHLTRGPHLLADAAESWIKPWGQE